MFSLHACLCRVVLGARRGEQRELDGLSKCVSVISTKVEAAELDAGGTPPNSRIWEVEIGESGDEEFSWLYNGLDANPGYIRSHVNNKNVKARTMKYTKI